MPWPAIIGGIAALAGSGIMAGAQQGANTAAYNNSKAGTQWNAIMDSTAVQRRAADLRAAGMNPVLAAGSAASSTPANVSEPKTVVSENPGRAVGSAIDAMMAKEQLANIREQTQLTRMQQESVKADAWNKQIDGVLKTEEAQYANDYYRGRAGLPGASIRAMDARAALAEHDLSLLKEHNLPSMVAGSSMGLSGVPTYMAVAGVKGAVEGSKSVVGKVKEGVGTWYSEKDMDVKSALMSEDWFSRLPESEQRSLLDRSPMSWPKELYQKYHNFLGRYYGTIEKTNHGAGRQW